MAGNKGILLRINEQLLVKAVHLLKYILLNIFLIKNTARKIADA